MLCIEIQYNIKQKTSTISFDYYFSRKIDKFISTGCEFACGV